MKTRTTNKMIDYVVNDINRRCENKGKDFKIKVYKIYGYYVIERSNGTLIGRGTKKEIYEILTAINETLFAVLF